MIENVMNEYQVIIDFLLSSANEVWVGHRNAGRPSFCPSVLLSVRPSVRPSFRRAILSVRPTCERDIFRTISPFNFKFEIYQTTENTDAIDFGPCAKTKMAAIDIFNMYAIDTPCEHNIFRNVSPINFKFDL